PIVRIDTCDVVQNGTVSIDENTYCVTYTPNDGYEGQDDVCIIVCDATDICDTTQIIVNVTGTGDGNDDDDDDDDDDEFDCMDFDPVVGDSLAIFSDDCEAGGMLCTGLPFTNMSNYTITDNGETYTGRILGCDNDTTFNYLYVNLTMMAPVGPYELTNWTVNGDVFSTRFDDISELVDSMNVWDVAGSWVLDEQLRVISGGSAGTTYGNLDIQQVGTDVFVQISPDLALRPNGTGLMLTVGEHTLILTDNTTACTDEVQVTVTCDECELYNGDTEISLADCDEEAEICLDIPFAERDDYMVRVNGVLTGLSNTCATGSILSLPTGLYVVSITSVVDNCGDEIELTITCPDNPVVTPTIDTVNLALIIGSVDTVCLSNEELLGSITTVENVCEEQSGLATDVNILEDEACLEFTAEAVGQDTACIIFCDEFDVCDTTIYILRVMTPLADTVRLDLEIGQDSTYCFDDTEIQGDIIEIENICTNESGTSVNFSMDGDLGCVNITALADGTERGCFVFCDNNGTCDTTYVIVNVGTAIGNDAPIANNDTTTVLINSNVDIEVTQNDSIVGGNPEVDIVDDPEFGSATIGVNNTIIYTPNPDLCEETDEFTYYLQTDTGIDTATVVVTILCEDLIIYNGFSPNGDGVNDVFTILGIERFPNHELMIFNRWGNEVFRSTDYQNDWGGRWNNKDLPDGTYFYIFDNGTETFSGYVQIQR
ncbi:MAG: gliding motility-associated C-terminal domain-containing protein, partial [Bacteroidota bacterium]